MFVADEGLFASVAGDARRENDVTHQAAPTLLDNPSWKNQGIENLTRSPYAKLKNIPVHAVTIESGFWEKRRVINVEKSIPSMHDLLEANGRMNNFRRLIGKSTAAQSGPVYSDSDIYKWTEAVGFTLQSGPYPELRASAEKFIDDVVAAQQPNGYLNTYYVGRQSGAEHDSANADDRPRTLQHGAFFAGRDCVLSRHRRSARCSMQGSVSWTIFCCRVTGRRR